MTESEDVWAEVARRAAVSRFSGATADDDDVMASDDLREAQLNPNKQGGQNGVGGGGMMPPMMMGGRGGGGGGAAESGSGGGGGLAAGSMTAAAASTKPTQASTGLGVQAASAPMAEEVPEEPGVPDIGGLGGGGIGGGSGGGGGGAPEASGGVGAGAPPADGFSADPVAVRGIATKWAELAEEIHALEAPTFDAALGLVLPPERPQQAVNEQVRTWTTGAGDEFDALVARLHDVAGQYEAVEETGAAEIRRETADE